jgi:hypothetical protein
MSVTIHCDRCKTPTPHRLRAACYRPGPDLAPISTVFDVDLCGKCADEFRDWLGIKLEQPEWMHENLMPGCAGWLP